MVDRELNVERRLELKIVAGRRLTMIPDVMCLYLKPKKRELDGRIFFPVSE